MILITGSNGQLGYDFQRLFNEKKIDYLATDYKELDITDITAVRSCVRGALGAGKELKLIINCAAYNNVDKAETEPELCYKLNSYAPRDLALVAKEYGVPFITYSTDFVFDGKKITPYTEEDEPVPLSVYSKAKHEGELLTLAAYDRAVVVRTSWVFGVANNNFNKQVLGWAQTKKELAIVDDQVSVPTYSRDLAYYSWLLLQTGKSGLFHIANSGQASKYDQAKYLLDKTGWSGTLKRAKTADFPLPALRSPYSKLSTAKIEKLLGVQIPHWQNAIDRYLSDGKLS